ncbi:hypothetical protein DER44DRAFT_758495, partial [Fusarium oxysporum]
MPPHPASVFRLGPLILFLVLRPNSCVFPSPPGLASPNTIIPDLSRHESIHTQFSHHTEHHNIKKYARLPILHSTYYLL